jgi:hypothetical protein
MTVNFLDRPMDLFIDINHKKQLYVAAVAENLIYAGAGRVESRIPLHC